MSDSAQPWLGDLKGELRMLGVDVRRWARLHGELAQLEWATGAVEVKRLAIAWALAGVMGVVAMSLLAVGLAVVLDGRWGISQVGWLAIFGGVLLLLGVAIGLLGWRHFRRRFVGMQQTVQELKDDLAWIHEWLERTGG